MIVLSMSIIDFLRMVKTFGIPILMYMLFHVFISYKPVCIICAVTLYAFLDLVLVTWLFKTSLASQQDKNFWADFKAQLSYVFVENSVDAGIGIVVLLAVVSVFAYCF